MTCYIFRVYSANITNEKDSSKYSFMNFASYCHLFEGETNLIKLNLCFVFNDICHMMFFFFFLLFLLFVFRVLAKCKRDDVGIMNDRDGWSVLICSTMKGYRNGFLLCLKYFVLNILCFHLWNRQKLFLSSACVFVALLYSHWNFVFGKIRYICVCM